MLPSLHFEGRDPDVDSGWDCRVEDASAFHTYTVVWQRASMTVPHRRDGVLLPPLDARPPVGAAAAVRPPFSMILNMGVQDQGLSARTEFPAELVVDYAKAWR